MNCPQGNRRATSCNSVAGPAYQRRSKTSCNLHAHTHTIFTHAQLRCLPRPPAPPSWQDIESIVSYDHEVGTQASLLPAPEPDAPPGSAAAAREHRRGLTPCVFVPWEQVGG